jgi:hypothetical protein
MPDRAHRLPLRLRIEPNTEKPRHRHHGFGGDGDHEVIIVDAAFAVMFSDVGSF